MSCLCLLLIGCKAELYSGLVEKEGNEMLSILLDAGVDVDKIFDKKNREVTLLVGANDISQSVKILGSLGYPKEKFSSVGDIFPKDGLISSPTEERARYTYSMSQELSATLSMIDGVVAARVHVVLPQDQDKLSDIIYPSSTSVFIKYTSELELSGFISKVRTLVSNSIEGLELDKITVSLFPASRVEDLNIARDRVESVFSVDVMTSSATRLRIFIFVCIGLVLIAVFAVMFILWMFSGRMLNKNGKIMDTIQTGIDKVKEKTSIKKSKKSSLSSSENQDGLPEFGDEEDVV